jgi:hypothetical protein
MAILMDKYGSEFLEWDPLTVNLQIASDFGFAPRQALLDKVQAGSSVFTTNLFHLSLEAFSTISNTLNLGVTTSELFLPADLDDVLWGVSEVRLLEGTELNDTKFSHNIARYVGFLLADGGIQHPPSVLSFAEYPEHESSNVQNNIVEQDAVLYQAFWTRQLQEKEELEVINKNKLYALFSQLRQLPLKLDFEFVDKATTKLKEQLRQPQLSATR